MATKAELEAQLKQIELALAQPEIRVKIDNYDVQYRDADDLLKAKQGILKELAALDSVGNTLTRPRQFLAKTSRGID